MTRLPERVTGEGIVLRRWVTADVGALARAVDQSAEHLRPWMSWVTSEPQAPEAWRALVDEWERDWRAGRTFPMGVFHRGASVGGSGYVRRSARALEIGYWTHVAHLGQGYATSAARLLTGAAFNVPGIEVVEIHHDRANVRSAAIPRRLGYHFVGERPDLVAAPGEVGIDCTWRIERREWPPEGGGGVGHGQPISPVA